MQRQILLLPKQDYWSWVRASRDYVIRFGPGMTSDPEVAARMTAPDQVVSFPQLKDAYPGYGDLGQWLADRQPEIRRDPIEVDGPEGWESALQERIDRGERYLREATAFTLLWPTDYPVVTQRFGVNPEIYIRYGMPGHEGLDIRALKNTNVYCCADGVVYQVHTDAKSHAYGIHIRIRHADGFKTVYGHLAKSLVRQGEQVVAGQIIGKADSTGASTASHLHLTLKREGATSRGETRYPKDVIDPTPYLVWPGSHQAKAGPTSWPAARCLIGAHGRAGAAMQPADLEAIWAARLEAVMISLKETADTLVRLQGDMPNLFILARVTADLSAGPVSADAFLRAVESDVSRLAGFGVRYFEIHANPNLQSMGWRRSWQDGSQFAEWYLAVLSGLRAAAPGARFGFPCLSPGGDLSGWRASAGRFLGEAESAAVASDWLGVHCAWTGRSSGHQRASTRALSDYSDRFPGKLLFVTEFYNASDRIPHAHKARDYLAFYRSIRGAAHIGAAFAFAVSAAGGHETLIWRKENGELTDIPHIVGARDF